MFQGEYRQYDSIPDRRHWNQKVKGLRSYNCRKKSIKKIYKTFLVEDEKDKIVHKISKNENMFENKQINVSLDGKHIYKVPFEMDFNVIKNEGGRAKTSQYKSFGCETSCMKKQHFPKFQKNNRLATNSTNDRLLEFQRTTENFNKRRIGVDNLTGENGFLCTPRKPKKKFCKGQNNTFRETMSMNVELQNFYNNNSQIYNVESSGNTNDKTRMKEKFMKGTLGLLYSNSQNYDIKHLKDLFNVIKPEKDSKILRQNKSFVDNFSLRKQEESNQNYLQIDKFLIPPPYVNLHDITIDPIKLKNEYNKITNQQQITDDTEANQQPKKSNRSIISHQNKIHSNNNSNPNNNENNTSNSRIDNSNSPKTTRNNQLKYSDRTSNFIMNYNLGKYNPTENDNIVGGHTNEFKSSRNPNETIRNAKNKFENILKESQKKKIINLPRNIDVSYNFDDKQKARQIRNVRKILAEPNRDKISSMINKDSVILRGIMMHNNKLIDSIKGKNNGNSVKGHSVQRNLEIGDEMNVKSQRKWDSVSRFLNIDKGNFDEDSGDCPLKVQNLKGCMDGHSFGGD